ncbi:putative short-chain dehydrogenase/reductase SDR, NAD(P)-binding domain superfamily [Septoria linicola]|nr:putative short-chain dehydrogenase/reductase SDR, NAD(P)-binding domain superfamily [Septoria linicola]
MAAPNDKEIVLITGANTGLGLEIARKRFRFGRFHVFIRARTPLQRRSRIDIISTSSLTSAADTISQNFGRLDILHCNAGIAPEAQTPAGGATPISELIKLACDTNVAGSAQTAETFIPLLQKAENPKTVFMSTGLGSLTRQATFNNKNWPAYAATALNDFGKGGHIVPGKTEDGANNAVRLSLLTKDGESGTHMEMDDNTGEVRIVPW